MAFYHGTNPERASSMLKDSIDLEHPQKSDPGDFGLGFYLTENIHRAKSYGSSILRVVIDLSSFAYIPNPYQPDYKTNKASALFLQMAFVHNEMLTVGHIHPACRLAICKTIRQEFMQQGYGGIRTDYNGGETVVFNLDTIMQIDLLSEDEVEKLCEVEKD